MFTHQVFTKFCFQDGDGRFLQSLPHPIFVAMAHANSLSKKKYEDASDWLRLLQEKFISGTFRMTQVMTSRSITNVNNEKSLVHVTVS